MNNFIVYNDIKHVDLFQHFSRRYKVKKRVIETLVQMCDQWGPARTHEVLQVAQPVTYRQVRYIHKCVLLHKDLLFILKPGGSITERAILERLEDRGWLELIHEHKDTRRIKGTYRELVFRKA
jgi:hypothetical protein